MTDSLIPGKPTPIARYLERLFETEIQRSQLQKMALQGVRPRVGAETARMPDAKVAPIANIQESAEETAELEDAVRQTRSPAQSVMVTVAHY